MAYGQSCSIQVQLGSAITFGLASTTAVLGGPETASFPYLGFLNFLQKFYCGISDSEFYSFLWVTEYKKEKSVRILQVRDSVLAELHSLGCWQGPYSTPRSLCEPCLPPGRTASLKRGCFLLPWCCLQTWWMCTRSRSLCLTDEDC